MTGDAAGPVPAGGTVEAAAAVLWKFDDYDFDADPDGSTARELRPEYLSRAAALVAAGLLAAEPAAVDERYAKRRHNRCGLGDPGTCGHPDCPDMPPAEPAAPTAVEALMGSRLMWGLHTDRWQDREWQREFWTEAVHIVTAAVVAGQPAATDHDTEAGLRQDNADLARQLSDASRRRADAFDEGYDKAMQDAHYVLNRMGYLERRGEDNGNPYRAALTGADDPDEQP